jgi:YD repeat-containing protein
MSATTQRYGAYALAPLLLTILVAFDAGWLSRTAPAAPVIDLVAVRDTAAVTRPDLCLTIALDAASAYECGNLRVVHDLPAVNAAGTVRAPVLYYNSVHASATLLLAADITLPPGGTMPDSVTADAFFGSSHHGRGRWDGAQWTGGATRRITFLVAAPSLSGIWDITLEVSNWYGASRQVSTTTFPVPVVRRPDSPFGAGWWLAGLERLDPTTKTVTGGNGTSRKYYPAGFDVWVARTVDRADTLTKHGSTYRRGLPGGGFVSYEESKGRHISTQDRLGQTTHFNYSQDSLLTSIELPGGAGSYTFAWADGRLAAITAPGNRVTTLMHTGTVLDSVRDPDNRTVAFSYSSGRMVSRTDRRGTVTMFSYGNHERLTGVMDDTAGFRYTRSFVPAEVRGFSGGGLGVAVAPDSAYTLMVGPRPGVETRFWVDRYGAPRRIRDAEGNVTELWRQNVAFPALVTKLTRPGGFTSTTQYDARGRVTSMTDSLPWADGRSPTTTVQWSSTCPDYPEQVTDPSGTVTEYGYDGFCNRLWQQTGGSTRRTNFTYNSCGLVTSMQEPGSLLQHVLQYDAQCQLTQSTTPAGFITRHFHDSLGRDTLVVTPIDTVTGRNASQVLTGGMRQRIKYDIMSRVIETRTFGPSVPSCSTCGTVPSDELVVMHSYDTEGQLLHVLRYSNESWASTAYSYDALGRRQTEDTDAAQQVLAYDSAGNVIRYVRGGDTIRMKYDALNRLTERTIPAKSYAQSGCAPFTHLICTYQFPLYSNGSGGSLLIPADTQRFSYHPTGTLSEARNRDAIVRRGYFPNGQLRADTMRMRAYTLEPNVCVRQPRVRAPAHL